MDESEVDVVDVDELVVAVLALVEVLDDSDSDEVLDEEYVSEVLESEVTDVDNVERLVAEVLVVVVSDVLDVDVLDNVRLVLDSDDCDEGEDCDVLVDVEVVDVLELDVLDVETDVDEVEDSDSDCEEAVEIEDSELELVLGMGLPFLKSLECCPAQGMCVRAPWHRNPAPGTSAAGGCHRARRCQWSRTRRSAEVHLAVARLAFPRLRPESPFPA